MRALFDLKHPAQIHFFVPLMDALKDSGHEIIVTSRAKDETLDLLGESVRDRSMAEASGRWTLASRPAGEDDGSMTRWAARGIAVLCLAVFAACGGAAGPGSSVPGTTRADGPGTTASVPGSQTR